MQTQPEGSGLCPDCRAVCGYWWRSGNVLPVGCASR